MVLSSKKREKIEVSSLCDAVELANDLKKSGRFDLFRGQVQNWPIEPSLRRLNPEAYHEARARFGRLIQWAEERSSILEDILDNVQKLTAIAQHYGLPTTYLDFTSNPEIAGYFASDSSDLSKFNPVRPSCIVCISSKEFHLKNDVQSPGIVEIEVDNLWRLEAQAGHFVRVPINGPSFTEACSYTSIEFPLSSGTSSVPQSRIYPERKSSLEISLDEYFMNEGLIEAGPALETTFGPIIHSTPALPDYETEAFIGGKPPDELESWAADATASWDLFPAESWPDATPTEPVTISVNKGEPPYDVIDMTSKRILGLLSGDSTIRSQTLGWSVLDEDGEELTYFSESENPSNMPEASRKVERLWDGIRNLPYSDEQVARSIANYVGLVSYEHFTGDRIGGCFSGLWGATGYFEFGRRSGAYSRAICSQEKLVACFRSDIESYLSDRGWVFYEQSKVDFLGCLSVPNRILEFEAFVDLLAEQIIPAQIHIAEMGNRFDPVFFSPTQIDVIGPA